MEVHSFGVVAVDCLSVGGCIIVKLHHFFFCILGDFDCLSTMVFSVNSIAGSTVRT